MTNRLTLDDLKKHLQFITSSYSSDDWKKNKDELVKLRELTYEPRDPKECRSAQGPVKETVTSLQQLFELPDNGQSSSEMTEPDAAAFEDDKTFTENCASYGLQPIAIGVAKAVFRSLDRPESVYENIWHKSTDFPKPDGTIACRLLRTDDLIEEEEDVNGARYRVNALLFALHYRVRCEAQAATKHKETIVLRKIMEESGKSAHHIKNLLKRGRWYALWVNKLGLGAILTLGGSLASSNKMHDIDCLIKACKAMPGFCERSRKLSEFARKAIVEAIIRSGQTAPVTAQRYLDYPDTAVRQQIHDMDPQWRATAELGGQHGTSVQQASFRPSPDVNDPTHVTLHEAGEALPRPVAATYPEPQAQTYLGTGQAYGNVGVDGTAWDGRNLGTSYEAEEVDLNTWNFTFPMPSFVLQ